MGFVFKKLNTGEVVSSDDGMVFRKLSTEVAKPITPVVGIDPQNFSLSLLMVDPGTYTIVATAHSTGLKESKFSDSVEYIRNE